MGRSWKDFQDSVSDNLNVLKKLFIEALYLLWRLPVRAQKKKKKNEENPTQNWRRENPYYVEAGSLSTLLNIKKQGLDTFDNSKPVQMQTMLKIRNTFEQRSNQGTDFKKRLKMKYRI